MDKPKLDTIVYFVEDIHAAAESYAALFNAPIEVMTEFNRIQLGDLAFGFHPADERSPANTVVPYFVADDLDLAITNAKSAGFGLHRGPTTVGKERIAQVRNDLDIRIGFVQKL